MSNGFGIEASFNSRNRRIRVKWDSLNVKEGKYGLLLDEL